MSEEQYNKILKYILKEIGFLRKEVLENSNEINKIIDKTRYLVTDIQEHPDFSEYIRKEFIKELK